MKKNLEIDGNRFTCIEARVWEWKEKGSWHIITIKNPQTNLIKQDWHWPRRGFGSIPVKVQIKKTEWQTSIFPEKKGSYLLPIKRLVRDQEGIKAGDTISLTITVLS